MPGLRADQLSLYRKDMYKAEREGGQLEEVKYPKIFKVVSGKEVTGAGTKNTQILSAGALARHESEGQSIAFRSPLEGWTSYAKYHTYSDGLTFSFEAIEDTIKLGDMLKNFANTWGEEVRIAKETLAARIFNEGGNLLGDFVFNGSYTGETDPSGNMLYDNKPLFNLTGNKNTTKGGGTYYNSVPSAYPSSGRILPSQFETLYNLMTATNNRDEQDRIKPNRPDTVLTRPGADYFAMDQILNSDKLSESDLNNKNSYKGLIKQVLPWDYLTESAVYVGKAQHDSFQFHERQAPLIRFFRDENTLGYKASIVTRFGPYMKFGCRRAWVRGGGTSA